MRYRISVRPGCACNNGRRSVSASTNLPALTSARAADTPGPGDRGKLSAAFDAGTASRRKATDASALQRKPLYII